MRTPSSVLPSAVLLLGLLVPTARADVLVVDAANGPGTDFTSLAAAVTAAAEGDVLLVRDGTYGFVLVDGKSLVVQADTGASPSVTTGVQVQNLSASQSVTLRGIDLQATQLGTPLVVQDCQGPVWVEEALVLGTPPGTAFPGGGARVTNCASVLLSRCVVQPFEHQFLSPGLEVSQATVTLHASTVHGPKGFDQAASAGNPGGVGVLVTRGVLAASDSLIVGGAGGNSIAFGTCHDGGAGGPGLQLVDGTRAALFGSGVLGGPGGQALAPCVPGATGPATIVGDTSVLDSNTRGLGSAVLASPVRESGSLTLDVVGEPGAYAWLLYGNGHVPAATSAAFLGPRHVAIGPVQLVRLGPLPPGGALQVTAPALPLGVGELSHTLYVQPLTWSFPDRRLRLGSGSAMTTLDDSL